MITIKEKKIFSNDGTFLKVIDCPRKVAGLDLTQISDLEFHCDECEKKVVATDFLSEDSIVELITDRPETCLKISCFDPRFRFET